LLKDEQSLGVGIFVWAQCAWIVYLIVPRFSSSNC